MDAMSERQNTLCCIFDPRSPRITAYHIHEWIYEQMGLHEDAVSMIQIDGPRRRVYIKFVNALKMSQILDATNGQLSFRHENGEQSTVAIEIAGMGRREIRIAALPPEVTNNAIKDAFAKYGEVTDIKGELWTTSYRYKVSNGVRLVRINLKHHLPSRLVIAGHSCDVTYPGQPPTCYACSQIGHIYQQCPQRRRETPQGGLEARLTWAQVAGPTKRHERTGPVGTVPVDNPPLSDDTPPLSDDQHMDAQTDMPDQIATPDHTLTSSQQPQGTMNMEIVAVDGDGSDAQTTPDSMVGMVTHHAVQLAPLLDHAGGDHQIDSMHPPNVESRVAAAERGSLNPVPPDERVEKRDTDTAWIDAPSTHEPPLSNPKKSKKFKTENTPKSRERTRSKTRHIDAT